MKLSRLKTRPPIWMKRSHTKAENIKQLYCSWNYNIWNKTLCPDVTFIKAFPWHRLSLSISNMELIIWWLTWNKMAISPNTNTHWEWAITFLNKIQTIKNINKTHYTIIDSITRINTIHATSLYHLKFIFQSPITLHMNHALESRHNNTTNFIINNSQALCNNYTETLAYMQCGTMSLKNHTRTLRCT